MAQLKIKGNVRIGHIYECYFGLFKATDGGTTTNKQEACEDDYNYRVPNEMIKKRAVVVVGKHRGQYLVVPISSSKETNIRKPQKEPENTGMHTKLQMGDFPETHHYTTDRERWAKSNLICAIDGARLRDIYNNNISNFIPAHMVTENTLKKIREGVIISIGMRDLLI
ncbi:type II toxin-antitoxin system PemK/MazF family toxin [Moritella viscosa]|uniref:Uncharacterized protein HI_0080 n=1 Tax=Moritella viscosa TaxID=80854 RepID=A0ABY1HJZ6_9GAMM|nr:type II toxin-antitoxin system PemK/MazF family toxin [Moritella viscosa]SGZ03377.1 Uncharacterized protein HI_0080 [Moritella viscosa]